VITRRDLFVVPALALAIALCGCHKSRNVAHAPARAPFPTVEIGLASWYGHPYHGRPAADGEIYDMEKMTAAHRTLPFNTWVRVTNLGNGRSVELRIIDRGPFVEGRVIDVSHAAAQQLDLIGPGVASVRVEVISAPAAARETPALYAVQVGSFMDRARAARLASDLNVRYGGARIEPREGDHIGWRVLVGAESSMFAAEELADSIQAGKNDCFVVRLDQPASPAASSAY